MKLGVLIAGLSFGAAFAARAILPVPLLKVLIGIAFVVVIFAVLALAGQWSARQREAADDDKTEIRDAFQAARQAGAPE